MVNLRSRFEGADYETAADKIRLSKQIGRVFRCMEDGFWRTLEEIANVTGDHESSISAQLRNLRKPKFGSWTILRRPRGDRGHGLYEYRLAAPREAEAGQSELQFADNILKDLTESFFSGVNV